MFLTTERRKLADEIDYLQTVAGPDLQKFIQMIQHKYMIDNVKKAIKTIWKFARSKLILESVRKRTFLLFLEILFILADFGFGKESELRTDYKRHLSKNIDILSSKSCQRKLLHPYHKLCNKTSI